MATGYLLLEDAPTGVSAGFAGGIGAASNAVAAGVSTNAAAGSASGTCAAFNAVTSGTGQPINVAAGLASGVGAASVASKKLARAAGLVTGSGAAGSTNPKLGRPAGVASGAGSALSIALLSSRPDIASAPAASDLVLWAGVNGIDDVPDAQFIDWRDNWGITTIVCQFSYMWTMGGGNRRNAPANATFDAADGRTGAEWDQCRKIKYGNTGVGTSGLGNVVTRLHNLGMKIYAGTRLPNLNNALTMLFEWFNDAQWTTLASATGPLGEHVTYAKVWGFDGIAFDDEAWNNGGTWKYTYAGNGNSQAVTRAKCKARGAQLGALFASLWPDVDIIEYNTTGTGGFPDDWDEDFAQLVNDPTGNIKETSMQRDLWDGVFSDAGFTGNLRFLQSTFYRSTGSGATWFGAEHYNAIRQLARLSRTWSSWGVAHSRFHLNPFHWPGHATNVPEDHPMSLATMQASFAASRILGMGHIGFYYQSYSLDQAYFTTAMKAVFQAARVPGTVNSVVPTLSAITQSGRSGNNITLSGTAGHPLGIRYIEWEVFNAAGTAIETTGAFGHTFTPGAGNHQSVSGFADATYPFDATISAPAGRTVRVTAVSIKNQSHSTTITASGSAAVGPDVRPFASSSPWNTPTPGGTVWFDTPLLHIYPGGGADQFRHWWVATTSAIVWYGAPTDPLWTFNMPDYIAPTWNRNRPAQSFQRRAPANMLDGGDSDHIVVLIDTATGDYVEVWNSTVNQGARTVIGTAWATGNTVTGPGAGTLGGLNDGVRAANFSWAGGLITGRDLAAGTIDHALVLSFNSDTLKGGNGGPTPYRAPATCADAGPWTGLIIMGSRIGIPAGTAQPGGLSTLGVKVFNALKTYGAFVGDYAGGTWPMFYADKNTVTNAQVAPLYEFWNYGGSADMEKIGPLLRVADYQP